MKQIQSSWRRPVLVGLIGVLLATAGLFSRLTEPALPQMVRVVLIGSGILAVLFYITSSARSREERLTPSLNDDARNRLRKQKPVSIFLAFALFVLLAIPFCLFLTRALFEPAAYNAAILCCLIGMAIWCVVAVFAHSARQKILDDHEQSAAIIHE